MSTAPRLFPFGAVPVYNPGALSREEAIAQFHARQGVYQQLLDGLAAERPSHVLIIGPRGMGKTTLLQRIRYGVDETPALSQRLLPLAFPEEQYNVTRLKDFLLNTVDSLADAAEQMEDHKLLDRVEVFAEQVGKRTSEEIEREVPAFLKSMSEELGRGFLLLVDNADRLIDTIDPREQWRLRELLSASKHLTFIGATTQASEGIYAHDRAFFEFFQIKTLSPLSHDEVRAMMLRLGEATGGNAKERVETWLDEDPARLRTLVQLTGGNPRTTVLLFGLVLDGLEGTAREYLERLLDLCTPNYKGRIDELPPQAQQVLDALALNWDPAEAATIAEASSLDTGSVSTQLTRLIRQGIVEKTDPGEAKKTLYQVAERFFNIWYLMRASRRVRARMRWFIEFLRVFFDPAELARMAQDRLEAYKRGKLDDLESLLAYAFAANLNPQDFLARECAIRRKEWEPYLAEALEVYVGKEKAFAPTVEDVIAVFREFGVMTEEFDEELATCISDDRRFEISLTLAERVGDDLQNYNPSKEAAARRLISLTGLEATGLFVLGRLLLGQANRDAECEDAFRKALELEPNRVEARVGLATVISRHPNRVEEARAEYDRAVRLDPEDVSVWSSYTSFLVSVSDFEGALLTLGEFRRLEPLRQELPIITAILLAVLTDFPRATVALEDALKGDPIELYQSHRKLIDVYLRAAVAANRTRETIEVIEKKDWVDAWRPIYEALRAIESGNPENHLKRIAVELREPARMIIARITPVQ